MQYEDQYAESLNLNLITGDFDKESLSILVEESLKLGDSILDVAIIGASHFVTLRNNEKSFTELFACIEYDKNCINKASDIEIERENYKFVSMTQKYKNKESFIKHIDNFRTLNSDISMEFEFESLNNIPAITSLKVIIDDSILVQTIHAYPNEMNIVQTISIIRGLS